MESDYRNRTNNTYYQYILDLKLVMAIQNGCLDCYWYCSLFEILETLQDLIKWVELVEPLQLLLPQPLLQLRSDFPMGNAKASFDFRFL